MLCVPLFVLCVSQVSTFDWDYVFLGRTLSLEQTVMSMNPRSTTLDSLSQVLAHVGTSVPCFSNVFIVIYSFSC